MSDSYTSYWSKGRCEQMRARAPVEERLTLLFGGPHQSQPVFRRFGVKVGDYIYPVTVSGGILFILGRMRVRRLLSIDEFIAENPQTFAGFESNFGAEATFDRWRQAHPEFGYLAPTCTSEVALGEEGTPLGLKVAVPADVLEGLRFCSQRGERGVKHVVDGRLKSILSFDGGTYRLSEASACQFEAVLAGALAVGTI